MGQVTLPRARLILPLDRRGEFSAPDSQPERWAYHVQRGLDGTEAEAVFKRFPNRAFVVQMLQKQAGGVQMRRRWYPVDPTIFQEVHP